MDLEDLLRQAKKRREETFGRRRDELWRKHKGDDLSTETPSPEKFRSNVKRVRTNLNYDNTSEGQKHEKNEHPSISSNKLKPSSNFFEHDNDSESDDGLDNLVTFVKKRNSQNDDQDKVKSHHGDAIDGIFLPKSAQTQKGKTAEGGTERRQIESVCTPRNPITLMKAQYELTQESTRFPPISTDNEDLWSDREAEEIHSPQKKVLIGENNVIHATKLSTSDSNTPEFTNMNSSELKPEFTTFSKFGPFAFEPLPLEPFDDGLSVPASINRYLPEFQREGVKFLYQALKHMNGAILGENGNWIVYFSLKILSQSQILCERRRYGLWQGKGHTFLLRI